MRVTVLGCGRWGSFLSWYANKLGHEVILWGREASKNYQILAHSRTNEYLMLFVMALRERNETPHLNVTRYTQENDASYRKTLSAALSSGISHLIDEGQEGDERKNGIAAIDAWISAFEVGSANQFGTSYNLLWITSTRQYLVPFFTQSAITHCMGIQDSALQQLMMKAADVYLSSYRVWVGMRELFPFPKGADTTDPQLKAEAIRLLREARETEVAGLAVLRDIVGHLS